MYDTRRDALPPRAILAAVQFPDVSDEELHESLEELRRLAKTLGLEVRGRVTQKRATFDAGAYLGPGKVEELAKLIAEGRLEDQDPEDVRPVPSPAAEGEGDAPGEDSSPPPESRRPWYVLVDHEISPSQARNLAKGAKAEVMDRTAVILEIFHRHATSRAAKAQVEIVRLAYMAPRLRESRKGGGERQQGGIGGKGAGEAAVELDRRKVRDRIAELRLELVRIEEDRRTQRTRRKDLRRVALVGYTNAGKSTLMRALTGSEVYVADKLFATLDTTVRSLHPPVQPPILVSDTVGFIKKLPHGLVASFKSTLDEALEAGLLLHLVDASDPSLELHMRTTAEVLAEIGAGEVPVRLVLNKCDRIEDPLRREELAALYPDALIVSAKDPDDVARVRAEVVAAFEGGIEEAELVIPHERAALRARLFATCEVLAEAYDEQGGTYRVRGSVAALTRLRAELAAS